MSAAGCTSPEFTITTLNLSAVGRYIAARPAGAAGTALIPLPLSEAIQLAKSVLLKGRHTSQDNALWLNRLRILMKDSDGRAARNPQSSIGSANSVHSK